MRNSILAATDDHVRWDRLVQYYDTLSVPLVYTQVVTLAVYTYFAAALMGLKDKS